VQQKFRLGGVSRPKGFTYPYPVLEARVKQAGNVLLDLIKFDAIDEEGKRSALKAINIICELPMDISLLKSSGIGKAVKKFLKSCDAHERLQCFDEPITNQNIRETPRTKLDTVLQSWMSMAAKSGVKMKDDPSADPSAADDCDQHLAAAKNCKSWRELYIALKEYDEKRRSNQGARMRERRQRLDSVRPKIVKVRHASSRQNSILNRQHGQIGDGTSTSSLGKLKIDQLRKEARVVSTRRAPPVQLSRKPVLGTKPAGGFGAAVAFAHGHNSNNNRKTSTTMVELAGGKRMKMPDAKKKSSNIKKRLGMLKKGAPSARR
jgi:hypothetical protein